MNEKQFIEKYCQNCGSQRCEGIGTVWFKGCHYKNELDKKYKLGMYLGRFQPFHNGHKFIVDKMLEECEKVLIVVGSAQEKGTVKNPFPAWERANMIASVYKDKPVSIVCMPDRLTVGNDSGDPIEWGEKLIAHYEKLGIDPKTKTLLFSDSLDFDRAQAIYNHFKDRINVSFGIGTFLTNDTEVDALNIVIKLQYVNGHPVAKLSDNPGKTMCQDADYINYLRNAVEYRLKEGI